MHVMYLDIFVITHL